MDRYPLSKFPKTILKPEVVVNHEHHLNKLVCDVDRYIKVGGGRSSITFDWLLRVFENLSISTVKQKYLESLAITKTKIAMFILLIDDVVDNANKRDFILLAEMLKIPFNLNEVDESKLKYDVTKYFKFSEDLWIEIIEEIKRYPYYKKYQEAFEFDLNQVLNSMKYSRFVNTHPNAVNLTENGAYVHHGMMVLLELDLDLMCSDKFNDNELGLLRELAYLSQKLARIGNLIGTYPREIIETDMSSEALVKFKKEYGENFQFRLNKFLNRESRYPKFEKKLIVEWQEEYQMIQQLAHKIKSINTDEFIRSLEFFQTAYKTKIDR